MQRDLIKRFWAKVQKTESCWLWTGETNNQGYGRIAVGGKQKRVRHFAHRLSLAIHGVAVPAGMKVLHSCDVPLCVNPDHLVIGTQLENMHDAISKGRLNNAGANNGMARLTLSQVREIKQSTGGNADLAKKMGISERYVSSIRNGRRWRSA